MNIFKYSTAVLVLLVALFSSCSQNVSVAPVKNVGPSSTATVYISNPYEWVGNYHNNVLGYLASHYSSPFNPVWPSNPYIDSICSYVDATVDTLYPSAGYGPILNDSITEAWMAKMGYHCVTMRNDYEDLLNNSTYLTSQDKIYSLKVLELAGKLIDSSFTTVQINGRIALLEAEILSQDWDTNEVIALMSISLLKKSIQYHTLYSSVAPGGGSGGGVKDRSILLSNKQVALGVTDFVGGAAAAVSAVSATGGVGAAAGLWIGLRAAGACSGAASLIGDLCGWW